MADVSFHELVERDAEGLRESVRAFEQHLATAPPALDRVHCAVAEVAEPLELALRPATRESQLLHVTGDVATDSHAPSVAVADAGGKVGGCAVYSAAVHDAEGWR